MPEFQWVKAPVFSPTQCLTCSTHADRDGFVDLLAENALGHRMYICASCARQAGQKVGCYAPKEANDLVTRLAAASVRINELERELEAERDNKVVSLQDVKELIRQRGGRPASTVA